MNGPNTTDLWLLIFYPKKMKIIKNKTKQKSKEKNVMWIILSVKNCEFVLKIFFYLKIIIQFPLQIHGN